MLFILNLFLIFFKCKIIYFKCFILIIFINKTVGDNLYFHNIRCYSCTSLDGEKLLNDIKDFNWHKWMENIRYAPFTDGCSDTFTPDVALRSGAKSQECENGICMKMELTQVNGTSNVWRGCIPKSKDQIRPDCTKISSNQGSMEICTCNSHLCNSNKKIKYNYILIIIFIIICFYINFNI
uniref:UPAR/Ly6 domain-containing protein qvr n=1 Tax=Strongyloides stercoralis TaxID=6248 RepID=A0A0K0DYZ6_STRER